MEPVIFYVGEFARSEDADYDLFENQQMCTALGKQLVNDMLKHSSRAWKEYRSDINHYPPYHLVVKVFCEFTEEKTATWFTLKYPQVEIIKNEVQR
jgi:hypothetical protein